jgi:hypothetical protein
MQDPVGCPSGSCCSACSPGRPCCIGQKEIHCHRAQCSGTIKLMPSASPDAGRSTVHAQEERWTKEERTLSLLSEENHDSNSEAGPLCGVGDVSGEHYHQYHATYMKESVFGAANILLAIVAAVVGVWRIGAKPADGGSGRYMDVTSADSAPECGYRRKYILPAASSEQDNG